MLDSSIRLKSQSKAAEDCRSPKPVGVREASWSAAALCRFGLLWCDLDLRGGADRDGFGNQAERFSAGDGADEVLIGESIDDRNVAQFAFQKGRKNVGQLLVRRQAVGRRAHHVVGDDGGQFMA